MDDELMADNVVLLFLLDGSLEAEATHSGEDYAQWERGGERAMAPQAVVSDRDSTNPIKG